MGLFSKLFGKNKAKRPENKAPQPTLISAPREQCSSMGTAYTSVVLQDAGPNKLLLIKTVMELTGLGLREAKAVADATPSLIKAGVFRHEAELIKEELEKTGAKVEIA